MQNKRFLSTIGLLLTVFSVSSCSGGIDPNPDWTIDVEATKKDVQLLTYFPNSGKSGDFFQNSYIPQKLEEITGYKVTFNQTSEGGADTQVQTILTGKEPVDMLKISPTLFNNYVTQGYFTDLTDGLEKYAPNVMSLSKITEQQWEACSYNGKIYAIPEVGHTTMNNLGLAWNMDHLASVGIDTMPNTISEFEDAMVALQAKYGGNANYHVLGIAGTHADANPFSATFDVPKNWFVNENGELENVLFSDRTEQYLSYMHTLASRNMIASGWSGQSSSTVISNFVQGFSSCIVLSYWEWTPLRDSLVAAYPDFPSDIVTENQKKAYVYGVEDHEYGVAPSDAMVQYNLYITGDGNYGTNYQEKGKVRDSHGIAYYITVPVASAKDAAYTLDWINYKQTEEVTILQIAGEENVHYQKVTKDDPDAIKLLTEDGEPEEYVKILDAFYSDISGMSQYQTAVNPDVARKWWPVAEAGFDAWSVLVTDEERLILDPFAVHPVLEEFAKVDLLAQNYVITQQQNIINKGVDNYLQQARETYLSRYWKDSIKNEVNNWFKGN